MLCIKCHSQEIIEKKPPYETDTFLLLRKRYFQVTFLLTLSLSATHIHIHSKQSTKYSSIYFNSNHQCILFIIICFGKWTC